MPWLLDDRAARLSDMPEGSPSADEDSIESRRESRKKTRIRPSNLYPGSSRAEPDQTAR
jgi:hypothetical protein